MNFSKIVRYKVNGALSRNPNNVRMDMVLNKYTGPGSIKLEVLTEANVRLTFLWPFV